MFQAYDFRLCLRLCRVLAEPTGQYLLNVSLLTQMSELLQSRREGVDRRGYIQLVITGLRTSNLNINKLKDLTDGVYSEQI